MRKEILMKELEELLNEDVSSVRDREEKAFDQASGIYKSSIVLFGSGDLGRKILSGLRKAGNEPLAFTDSNPAKWGELCEGIPVLSNEEAARRYGAKAVFVVSVWSPNHSFVQTKKRLHGLNCLRVVSFMELIWKYHDIFLPYGCFALPHEIFEQSDEIKKTFNLWSDENSCRQYLSYLRWRIFADFEKLPLTDKKQYFPHNIFTPSGNEVFIDNGAFDGDTIRMFLDYHGDSFEKIIAFEPDHLNFLKLKKYISGLDDKLKNKIIYKELATGEYNGKIKFEILGNAGSSISNNSFSEVQCVTLDEALISEAPTFLKFDIEGSEVEALKGARKLIETYRPVLAVCLYHNPQDLWKIPLYINSISSSYYFFMRSYGSDGHEIVCYAVPENRLLKKEEIYEINCSCV